MDYILTKETRKKFQYGKIEVSENAGSQILVLKQLIWICGYNGRDTQDLKYIFIFSWLNFLEILNFGSSGVFIQRDPTWILLVRIIVCELDHRVILQIASTVMFVLFTLFFLHSRYKVLLLQQVEDNLGVMNANEKSLERKREKKRRIAVFSCKRKLI